MPTRATPVARLLGDFGPKAVDKLKLSWAPVTGGATPDGGTALPDGQIPIIAFCSDEDIARRAMGDFVHLAGPSQNLARGIDGGFSDDPWVLTSASVDFATQGVEEGDIAVLTFPRVAGSTTNYTGPAQTLAVQSVSGSTLTLRRVGLAVGMGDPPCPPAGFTAPVQFVVPTLYPQVIDASRFLRETYGLDDRIWGRRTVDLAQLTQFLEPCVFKVLTLRYLDAARSAGKEAADDFRAKYQLYKDELDSVMDRLSIHFKPDPMEPERPDQNRFGTRLSR